MTVLRKPGLVLCLLVATAELSSGQAAVRQDTASRAKSERSGNWSARTSTGRTLMGTWTAVPDTTNGTVIGTWALVDAQGRPVASGAWSASKAPARWMGNWRGVATGRTGEYSGTWTSSSDLEGDASFGDLFEAAAQAVVGGTWREGRRSGSWSIRSAKREGAT